jgi:cell division protein ZipA
MEKLLNFLINNLLTIAIGLAAFSIALWVWRYLRRRRHIKMLRNLEDDVYTASDLHTHLNDKSSGEEVEESTIEPPLVEEVVEEAPSNPAQPFSKSERRKTDLIIAFYVIAKRTPPGFAGADIFTVLEDLGLKYGEMKIFHHYGVGDVKLKKAIFSVANLVEPGIFDLSKIDSFVTPGLAFFMQLPGPFGGRVAFELMLNNAQRTTEMLEGQLLDAKRNPLDSKTIISLRQQITEFEQR